MSTDSQSMAKVFGSHRTEQNLYIAITVAIKKLLANCSW